MIVQVQFLGAQGEALARATLGKNRSAFVREAVARAVSSVLGEDFPEAVQVRRGPQGGSRNPAARALGLSTSEYRRRLGVLAKAGLEATPEAVAAVPPPKRRGGKIS